jgi:hypothetical protein
VESPLSADRTLACFGTHRVSDPPPEITAQAKPQPSRTRSQTQFIILPPSIGRPPDVFSNIATDDALHDTLLAGMQYLRGTTYLKDGALRASDLTADGRHESPVDQLSWHVLSLDREGQICSCLRYLDESNAARFENLWIRHSALARCPEQGRRFQNAVEREMARARQMRMGFGEVGGWAVAEGRRLTLEAIGILLATYGLLELLGGCMGMATATFRHSSATILRKIGLSSVDAGGVELQPYFDPSYGCEMEVLQFDSRFPGSKYISWVKELAVILKDAPIICRSSVAAAAAGGSTSIWNLGMKLASENGLPQTYPESAPVSSAR